MNCLNCQERIQVSVRDKTINCGEVIIVPVKCPHCKAINNVIFGSPSVTTVHVEKSDLEN